MTPILLRQSRRKPHSGYGSHAVRVASLIILIAPALFLTGCQSIPPSPANWWSSITGRESRIDATALKDRDSDPTRNIDDVVGPLQRQAMKRTASRDISPKDAKDHAALKAAQKQFDEGQYAVAARGFSSISKKRNPSKFELFGSSKDRPTYDPLREEAVFYLAESQFQQNQLSNAANNYQMLVKDYPSTRYMDEATRRLFEISKQWLGVDGFATTEEIRQVDAETGAGNAPLSSQKATSRFSVIPNFNDPSRPVFDQGGHALKSLKTIWLNDPSGPLADDALMLAATYYLRNEEYRESARLFRIIREQFPKSPHLQNAFVLGSHVEQMSYQGPAYDDQLLQDSKQLKEQALRLYPDLPEGDRLRRELKSIYEAEARIEWELAEFYAGKNKPKAVVISCREILSKYPESTYAPKARAKLAELGIRTGRPATSSRPASSEPAMIPLRPAPENAAPLQQVPDFGDRGSNSQGDQVFRNEKPIFDDDPPPESNSGVGRAKL